MMATEFYVYDNGEQIGYVALQDNGKYIARCWTKGISVLRDENKTVIYFDDADSAVTAMEERYKNHVNKN